MLLDPQQVITPKPSTDDIDLDKIKSEGAFCRICLCEENSDENPLIAPCRCDGTMRLIHPECLRNWFLQKRVTSKNDFITTFYWPSLDCELCKVKYPTEIKPLKASSTVIKVIEYDTPPASKDYLVWESVSKSASKVVHVIDLSKQKRFFVGRGFEADLRVNEISVSRLHASVFKSPQGLFYLCDNGSKFGTLVQITQPTMLKPQKLVLQQGSSILTFQAKQPSKKCFPTNPTKKLADDPQSKMVSFDGLSFFPREFCTPEYLD